MRNKSFKLIFEGTDNQQIDLDYQLHDSIVAQKWYKKIKHLQNIPIDEIESEICDVSDLKTIYGEFCIFANIKPINFKIIDQSLLNNLHKLYEKNCQDISRKKNNSILYKFHHSIHYNENGLKKKKYLTIGWGTKEGLLTEQYNCNRYYEPEIKKNNIYLPWSELGKTPFTYWKDQEPNNQHRINELCKPHRTMRAKFFIPYNDIKPKKLGNKFEEWFGPYKDNWLSYYDIGKWNEIDEYSSPLLAVAKHTEDISHFRFIKIII